MTGSLSTLNVGEGDVVVTFAGHDDAEVDKALDMLEDMQKRGYAILVKQPDGKYARAHSIDRASKSYVVMVPQSFDEKTEVVFKKVGDDLSDPPPPAPAQAGDVVIGPGFSGKKRRGRPSKQSVGTSTAVAVSRSAGG